MTQRIVTAELTEDEYSLIGDLIAYAHAMDFFDHGCLDEDDDAEEIAELEAKQPVFQALVEKFGVDLTDEEVKADA